MADVCPFITNSVWKIDYINVSQKPVQTTHHIDPMGGGVLSDHSYEVTDIGSPGGDQDDVVYEPTAVLATIYCNNGYPSGTDGVAGSDRCKVWDTVNNRCGARSTDYLNNPGASPYDASLDTNSYGLYQQFQRYIDNFLTTIGEEVDLEDGGGAQSLSFMTQFLNVKLISRQP